MFKPLHVWSSKEASGNEKIIIIIIINKVEKKKILQCKTGKRKLNEILIKF